MKKVIGSTFELDLSNYAITTTDENSWFSDSFSSKITYPFEIQLTDELDIAFGFISRNTSVPTLYDVKYYEDDTIFDAQFEITGEEGGRVQASLEYGLEEFPLWETKLSELPLENFELVTEDMYTHAKNRVNKVWPEVNYTFPAVHAAIYKEDNEIWEYFEGQINNYQFGDFLENDFDSVEVISYNRNILQPFPSLIYVLNVIAQTAGYTLSGDALTDVNLIDNFVFAPKEYFIIREPLEIPVIKLRSAPDIISSDPDYGTYTNVVTLEQHGKYSIAGYFRTNAKLNNGAFRSLKFGAVTLYNEYHDGGTVISPNIFEKNYIEFEIQITNASASNQLTFSCESVHVSYLGVEFIDTNVFDFMVTLIAEYDNITDEPIPTITQAKEIDLRKAVPDMTVGELITALKNWHNYEYNIEGTEMIFNKIQDHMDFNNLTSLKEFEVKSKPRGFQQGMSFLLKFAEIADSKFTFDKVFQDVNGVQIQNYKENKKTKIIEINALPLPLEEIRNFQTASVIEKNESKLYIVRYQGLINGRNKTLTEESLLLPQIHATNFFKWFDFRINSVTFKIVFTAFNNQVKGLSSKSKIFMYNKLHYIKSIIKTQTSPDIVEVEIDTESLK